MLRTRSLLLAGLIAGAAACSSDTAVAPDVAESRADLLIRADDRTPSSLTLEKIGAYVDGRNAAAEIPAYDAGSQRLFVVNGALGSVDVLDLSNPRTPTKIAEIDVRSFGAGATSVAVARGIVALAIEGAVRTGPGTVAFYDAKTLELISTVPVGALPDMVTFTPNGKTVLVANEGEPNADYTVDPEGSVSVISLTPLKSPRVRTARFTRFDGQEDFLRGIGIRIYGPNARASQDFEPEYIAVSENGQKAYVTLQENNAVAVVDISGAYVERLLPLGYKDHRKAQNAFDPSDRDGGVNIRTWPVFGMYQPDAIAAYTVRGRTYFVTANEGDAREYSTFSEEARAGSLPLNTNIFTPAVCYGLACSNNAALGRLNVTTTLGRNPATGLYDALYAFGGRSFSIWSEDGRQVYDSGDELERRTSSLPGIPFNASNTVSGEVLDDRSDNKGPEPEGVALGRIGRKTFAFIGLERVGGVMVYDVTLPWAPSFVTYFNSRLAVDGRDLGPEGLIFISAKDSPSGEPLLVVGNEISGTTAIYRVVLQ